jgi:O-antigen/teichoic acid export membrane protein
VGQTLTRRLAANTAVQIAGRVVALLAGAASIAMLTRYLGPSGYGRYGLALSYTQLFGIVADVGLFTIVVREAARTPERTEDLVGTALTMRAVLAVGLMGIAVGVSFALPYGGPVRAAIAIAGAGVALNLAAGTVLAVFQARLRMERAVAAQIAGRLAAVAGVAAVAGLSLGFYPAVATVALGGAVTLIVATSLAGGLARVRPRWNRPLARELIGASIALGVALAINEVYFRADTLIISLYRPFADVGRYSLAYKVLELAVAFPAAFVASVFPVMSRLFDEDRARLRRVVQRAWDALVAFAVPFAAGGAILAPGIVRLAAGHGFGGAVAPLRLLLPAGALIAVNGLFGFAIIAARRQRQALWLNVTALTFNVALNFALVPAHGIVAAAAITLASEALILAGSWVLMRRWLGFFPSAGKLPRVAAAAVVMAACIWPLRDGPVVAVAALGALVYAVAAYALGGVDRDALAGLRGA